MKRGQYSVEYLFTVAFVMAILVTFVGVYWWYQNSSVRQAQASSVKGAGQDIIDNINTISSSGGFSLKKIQVGAPDMIKAMYVEGGYSNRLVINHTGVSGPESTTFIANASFGSLLDPSLTPSAIYIMRAHTGAIVLCNQANCTCRLTPCCSSGLCGTGACKNGSLCVSGTRTLCYGEVLPVAEIPFNSIDDNCDGTTS